MLTFLPGGPLTQTVSVDIAGDIKVEADEIFTLGLSNVTGRGVNIAGPGVATLVNDDETFISVTDAATPEGDSGARPMIFTVSLTNPSDSPVTVRVDTDDGTAHAVGDDYVSV